jgi:hypothetical protein
MKDDKALSLRRRGFLASVLGGVAVAAVSPDRAATAEALPLPDPAPLPPRLPAFVHPWDGQGDLVLFWQEAVESHEELPSDPNEGDACFVLGGPYADTAFVAISTPDFRGWVQFCGTGGE